GRRTGAPRLRPMGPELPEGAREPDASGPTGARPQEIRRTPMALMAWWHRRRDRRIAAFGGRPLQAGAVPAQPIAERFTPRPVDEAAVRMEIERSVNGLAPQGVDEATGHTLDNLVNSWADQWVADVQVQHADYPVRA